jgi:carbon monoxide dehydrogenase subunit G
MAKIQKSITINAPPEKIWAYLEDPMNVPEWLPGMIEVRNITGSGVGMRFEWTYKMLGIQFKGETEVTEFIQNERSVDKSKAGIESTWVYTYEPHEGGTKLSIDVDYKVPVPVLGKLAEKLILKTNEREAELALENIKTMVEA